MFRKIFLVLCQNLIHWQRYKRIVDAAWAVRSATNIEQSYPLDGSSPCSPERYCKNCKNCPSRVHHLRRVQSDLDRHSIVEHQPF